SANPFAEAQVRALGVFVVKARESSGNMRSRKFLDVVARTTNAALPPFDERLAFEQASICATMPEHASHAALGPRLDGFPQRLLVRMDRCVVFNGCSNGRDLHGSTIPTRGVA